jgi:hypothetical protein
MYFYLQTWYEVCNLITIKWYFYSWRGKEHFDRQHLLYEMCGHFLFNHNPDWQGIFILGKNVDHSLGNWSFCV